MDGATGSCPYAVRPVADCAFNGIYRNFVTMLNRILLPYRTMPGRPEREVFTCSHCVRMINFEHTLLMDQQGIEQDECLVDLTMHGRPACDVVAC